MNLLNVFDDTYNRANAILTVPHIPIFLLESPSKNPHKMKQGLFFFHFYLTLNLLILNRWDEY